MANNIQSAELMLSDAMVSASTSPNHFERSIELIDPRGCRDTESKDNSQRIIQGNPSGGSDPSHDIDWKQLTLVLNEALNVTVPAKNDVEHLSSKVGWCPV
jgi:hypothetical protein